VLSLHSSRESGAQGCLGLVQRLSPVSWTQPSTAAGIPAEATVVILSLHFLSSRFFFFFFFMF
jgi:hypothetical protein